MGVLVRCGSCGEVRWSILAIGDRGKGGVCEACGEPLSVERRRPGRRFRERQGRERRDFRPVHGPPA
jgi:hypothetical protein